MDLMPGVGVQRVSAGVQEQLQTDSAETSIHSADAVAKAGVGQTSVYSADAVADAGMSMNDVAKSLNAANDILKSLQLRTSGVGVAPTHAATASLPNAKMTIGPVGTGIGATGDRLSAVSEGTTVASAAIKAGVGYGPERATGSSKRTLSPSAVRSDPY